MKATKYIYDNQELTNKVLETVTKIEQFISDNSYQIKGDLSEIKNFKNKIIFESKSQKKKVNYAIQRLDNRMNLRSVNYFLHIIFKNILNSENRVRIIPSEKEIKIQAARKRWKEAQAISDKLLLEYKIEKGSFFKDQIIKKAA
jgi:hypothetical protein